ncbi:hypothetical protein OK016_08895 [Vibrio chagasii]|nr:hypothetical protein [Vibrio chagasii]
MTQTTALGAERYVHCLNILDKKTYPAIHEFAGQMEISQHDFVGLDTKMALGERHFVL